MGWIPANIPVPPRGSPSGPGFLIFQPNTVCSVVPNSPLTVSISFCLLGRFGRGIFILVFHDVVYTISYNLRTRISTGKLFPSVILAIPLHRQALRRVNEGHLSGIVGSSPRLAGLSILSSPGATLHSLGFCLFLIFLKNNPHPCIIRW